MLIGTAEGCILRAESGCLLRAWDHPLAALDWLDGQRREGGRWVGFLSYELGPWLEPAVLRGQRKPRGNSPIPLFLWGQLGASAQREACGELEMLPETAPASCGAAVETAGGRATLSATSNFTRDEYVLAVERCIEYIRAGDVFQVNLSQRLRLPFATAAEELYCALMRGWPARYGALLELDEFAVISNSPELFLSVSPDRRILTRPIKGTRPLLPGMDRELLESAKDAAELNMIVDLERNDLGRVCEIGSVHVIHPRSIEAHPTVYHGVAEIEGRLRRDVGLVELLRATFPGGSVTGAPKIRAMQIIHELEPGPRGVYCGAIGHLDADCLQLSLAIRTMTLDKRASLLEIPVGGGIVADSHPAAEYDETLVKARAALSAAAACSDARGSVCLRVEG